MNTITFGKYKGMPVTSVLRINPSYFGWCKNNVNWFKTQSAINRLRNTTVCEDSCIRPLSHAVYKPG